MVPREAAAQAIRIEAAGVPLAEALAQLGDRVDVVYAGRLVAGRVVTCRYAGDDPAAALACLLRDTGLTARPVHPGQYVLVARPPAPDRYGTLAGFVVDAETGEVLPGAHVYLTGRRQGTTTNEAGYFALPALQAGAQPVRISYLGYRTLDTLMTLQAPAAVLALHPTTLPAEEVVVEAGRADGASEPAVPRVTALAVRQLERLPATLGGEDLFQALAWLPGVQRSGEVTGGLLVRGSGPDQNLYLLDGAPVYHPWHAFSLISTFQTDTFKDITLYRGAYPAEHGGRLASVLDAELKDGSRAGPHVVSAINALNARFLMESPITGNSSFMFSARRSYLDKLIGTRHPVEDEHGKRDTLRTGYHFNDWSAKVSLRPGARSRLSASFYTGRDVLDLRLPFDLSLDFSSWLRPADLFFEVDQNWGNTLFSTRYQYLVSRRVYLTLTAYDTRYEAVERTFIQPTSSASVRSAYEVRVRDLGLKADVDYYRSLAHQIRAGVQVIDHRFHSALAAEVARSLGAVDTLDQRSNRQAFEGVAYVQDVWQPTGRWRIQAGARLSFFGGGSYWRLNPRLEAAFTVVPERLTVRATAGTQAQFMHRLRDRFSFLYDLVSSRWVPASRQVHPSRSAQASFGVESRPRPWLTASAEVYWRGARNILLPEDAFQTKDGLEGPGIEVGTLLGQYVPGRERAFGVELAARAERGPWHLWLSYAGGRSRNRALDEPTYRPARFDTPRTLQALVQREGRRWGLSVSALWRSGYPVTVPVARYVLGGPLDSTPVSYLYRPNLNNGRLPPYFRLDATVSYRFAWVGARWQARLHVYNVLNRRNVIGRFYDPGQAVVRGKDRHGLPLLPLFEFEMAL